MTRRSNAFTVAVLDLPSWADYLALPPGTFKEFTLNTPADIGMPREVLMDWDGGVFVPDFGPRGGMAIHGGQEHSPWTDSSIGGNGQQGVYMLDCDTRLYSRRCYPNADHTGFHSSGGGDDLTDDWGAYVDDGSPASQHTYCCLSYMPATWGGGPMGSMVRVSQSGGYSKSRPSTNGVLAHGYAATWRFDLSKSSHTMTDPAIFKLTGSSLYNFGGGPGANIMDAPTACIDLVRQGWWSTIKPGTGWGDRMVFTSKSGAISSPQGVSFAGEYGTLHHFADDDVLIRIDDVLPLSNTTVTNWRVHVWQAATGSPWQPAKLTRQAITDLNSGGVPAYVQVGETQPRWSSILGAFVWLDSQYPSGKQPTTTIRVWKLTPPPPGQRFTGTWVATWELVSALPGTESTNRMNMLNGKVNGDAGTVNGTFGRFEECPTLRAFVWTRDVDKPGQLVRLKGM